MRIKKLILSVFCILICMNLTGCGELLVGTALFASMKKSVESSLASIDADNLKEQVAYNNQFAQNYSTYNAGVKALETQNSVSSLESMKEAGGLQGIFASFLLPRAKCKASAAQKDYTTKLSTDKTYAKSVADAGKSMNVTGSNWAAKTPLIIFGGVLALLAMLIFLRKWSRRVPRSVSVMDEMEKEALRAKNVALKAEMNARLVAKDIKHNVQVTVNENKAEREARNECAKKGFNYEQLYAHFGTNQGVLEYCLLH